MEVLILSIKQKQDNIKITRSSSLSKGTTKRIYKSGSYQLIGLQMYNYKSLQTLTVDMNIGNIFHV